MLSCRDRGGCGVGALALSCIVIQFTYSSRKSDPPQGDREGPIHSSSLPPPLQRHASATARFVVFVRAGVGWCGAGTLAVALRWGCGRITECLWSRLCCPVGSQPTNICLGKCPSPSKSSSKNSRAYCALYARYFENNR